MPLQLTRPLVFFDVETTGTSSEIDRIVQIGLVKLYPEGRMTEWLTLVNPEIPIPPEVTEIHGITDDMVKDAPIFKHIGPTFYKGVKGCDIGGYNVQFDLRMIIAEFKRNNIPLEAGVLDGCVVDPFRIFSELYPRDLGAAVKRFCGEDLEGAHDALVDSKAALRVLMAQLEMHPDLPNTPEALHKFCEGGKKTNNVDSAGKFYWRHGKACMSFGKHPGVPLQNVPRGYLTWMLNAEFSPEVKQIVKDALEGKYPVREVSSDPE